MPFLGGIPALRTKNSPQLQSTAMKSKPLTPGTPAPKSGQYKNLKTGNEVTVVKGEPLPPTPKAGQGYSLADATKHKK